MRRENSADKKKKKKSNRKGGEGEREGRKGRRGDNMCRQNMIMRTKQKVRNNTIHNTIIFSAGSF